MKPEYISFLNVLREVARFHYDSTLTELAPEDLHTAVAISDEDFLRHLYQPREVEEVLRRMLRETDDLVCLVGPRGSGKSSVGLKVMSDLLRDPGEHIFMFRIDMRPFAALKPVEQTTEEEFRFRIRQRIIDNYKGKLFYYPSPSGRKSDNRELQLVAFLLDREPASLLEQRKPFQVFSNYVDLEDEAAQLFSIYLEQHPQQQAKATIYDWLESQHRADPAVRELVKQAKKLVDVPHVVYAARFVYRYDRQIIWFDNIDALPEGQQSQLVTVINQLYQLINHYAWVLVSVREENVFRQYDLSDAGAPLSPTRVLLEIPKDAKQHAYYPYPSCDLPVASHETIQQILQKRLEFTREYQRQRSIKLTAEIRALSDRLCHLSEEDGGAARDELEARLRKLRQHLSECTPLITDRGFDNLRLMSQKLLKAFEDEKAIYVANNCVRDLLPIFRDFLAFLLKSPNEDVEPPEGLEYDDWYVSTLFLMYMRHTMRTFHLGMYDVIALTETWYAQKEQSVGCFLPYLIVTALWNLTISNREQTGKMYVTPQVADVVERLAMLGYSREEVLRGIHELYYQDGSRSKLVEIRSKSLLPDWRDIEDRHVVYATYRGKCLVAHTGNSFGYFYECIRFRQLGVDTKAFQAHPDVRNTEAFANDMLTYLCDIAQMHVKTLWKVRQSGKLGGVEWLNNYYLYFGLPQIGPYARSTKVGRVLADIPRALHLESLIGSLLGYVRVGNPRANLLKLDKLYQAALRKVEMFSITSSVEEPPDIDFRRELGLRKRRV